MAKLIFLLDGNVIKEFLLDRERMTIGRRPTSDIHIDNLAISGEHAVIITSQQEVIIQDMNSTNGTLVNQQPVTKHVLSHGDTIGLGKYSLKFVNDGHTGLTNADGFADTVMVPTNASPTPSQESVQSSEANGHSAETSIEEKTPVIEVAGAAELAPIVQDAPAEADMSEQAQPEVMPEPVSQTISPRLNILNGDNAGSELMLDKSMVKVGEAGQQVAVITKRKDGFYITHVSGDDFPLVNDAAIGAQASVLKNHDVIEVLGVKMEVRLD